MDFGEIFIHCKMMDTQEQSLREEFKNLQTQLEHPDVFGRSDYPKLAKRQSELARLSTYSMRSNCSKSSLAMQNP
jgi:hypothetical protein